MKPSSFWREYAFAVGVTAAATAVSFAMFPFFELTNLVMVYLLGTLVVAARGHRGPSALSSVLNILAFDFCFVPPRFTFSVADVQYIWTFIVMFTIAMIISHLTVRLREEAQAAREGRERVETERLRSALLSSVSHDLRTPLAAILGSASALSQRTDFPGSPPARELLENIQTEAGWLSQLVGNLLEATRLESGKVLLRKELYPFEEILGSALDRLEKPLQNHGVALDIPADLPLVPIDPVLGEQLLINLLENALRYAPAKSRIEVSARAFLCDPAPRSGADGAVETAGWGPDPQFLLVTVADQGLGLKENELERVFDKFYHDPASPGAGLGLAICRGVVNAHGGRIWASNRPEGGAVFSFTLPLARSHELLQETADH